MESTRVERKVDSMNSSIILQKKIADENCVTTGILCTFHFWPGLVEIAMQAKLDYLIIDLEHLTFDAAMVAEACAISLVVMNLNVHTISTMVYSGISLL